MRPIMNKVRNNKQNIVGITNDDNLFKIKNNI
jgi:hypothetical protein